MMKEITRIHIAKTPYDVELAAKKELEAYIKQLSAFVNDQEVVDDIEVRITELFAEHGISKGGVVTLDDVHMVRAQLGEPHEFASDEGDVLAGIESVVSKGSPRRLYRDIETAILGGVLGGAAKFFGINVLWTRLVFLVLLLASFGTVALVYVVLWIAIPPARTAAEKLQLTGKKVTLHSIRELNETTGDREHSNTSTIVQKALLIAGGALATVAGVVALVAAVAGGLLLRGELVQFSGSDTSSMGAPLWSALALGVLSGLLLSTLCFLAAYAFFVRKLSKRMVVSGVTIIILGVLSFGTGIGLGIVGEHEESRRMDALRETQKVALPDGFSNVKRLKSSAHSSTNSNGIYSDFSIQYIVDSSEPRYVVEGLPDVRLDVAVEGDQARIVLKASAMQNRWQGRMTPHVVVYGPALDEVIVEQGGFQYSTQRQTVQDSLIVRALPTTHIELHGSYKAVSVSGGGVVDARMGSIHDLSVDASAVSAGVIRTLAVTQPDVCPADHNTSQSEVEVQGVVSAQMTYNGKKVTASTHETPCGIVVIGDDE